MHESVSPLGKYVAPVVPWSNDLQGVVVCHATQYGGISALNKNATELQTFLFYRQRDFISCELLFACAERYQFCVNDRILSNN